MKHPVNVKMHEERTFGQKPDAFTTGFGTWIYIMIQTAIIVVWMLGNAAYLAFSRSTSSPSKQGGGSE